MSENCAVLNEDKFDEALKSNEVVLVDFWADWCGPCKMLSPLVEKIASDYKGRVFVGKVNVDDEPMLAEKYGIISIPAVFIFKKGEIAERLIGFRQKAQLAVAIDKHL